MKIRPLGVESVREKVLHEKRRTDRQTTTMMVTFRNFVNAPKNVTAESDSMENQWISFHTLLYPVDPKILRGFRVYSHDFPRNVSVVLCPGMTDHIRYRLFRCLHLQQEYGFMPAVSSVIQVDIMTIWETEISHPTNARGTLPPKTKRPGKQADHSPPQYRAWIYTSSQVFVFIAQCLH
jgi:hypothetical protein